jgi:hypothetical protein
VYFGQRLERFFQNSPGGTRGESHKFPRRKQDPKPGCASLLAAATAFLCSLFGLASFAYAQWNDAPNGSVSTATWESIGPAAVQTPDFDLVTGRITAVALDPSDSTGNRLYVGTTGGGVWVAQNAATSNTSSIAFTPLTDFVQSLTTARDGSISIGALTV